VGTLAARAASVLVAMSLLGVSAVARAQQGQIRCAITENGSPASGSFAVEQGGRQVASGSCGRALSVPVGACSVTVRLNGALDNPAQTVNATVADGKTSTVAVDFKTAVLEVRIDAKGQRGTGMVTVEKNGRRIGTLGSGVAARLSAGSYEVIVRLGAQEQRHQVELRPGQRRLVRAQF
jgi:hypothetical protein